MDYAEVFKRNKERLQREHLTQAIAELRVPSFHDDSHILNQIRNKKNNSPYLISLMDTTIDNPFILPNNMVEMIKDHFKNPDLEQRAKDIFDWLYKKVKYGDGKRNDFTIKKDGFLGQYDDAVGYRNSYETFLGKEGVCGEMTFLYVISARASGLKSSYVYVDQDNRGRNVHHACAAVWVPRMILADVAYQSFDIKHTSYRIKTDLQAVEDYKKWRRS